MNECKTQIWFYFLLELSMAYLNALLMYIKESNCLRDHRFPRYQLYRGLSKNKRQHNESYSSVSVCACLIAACWVGALSYDMSNEHLHGCLLS